MEIEIYDKSLSSGRELYELIRTEIDPIQSELTFELRGFDDTYRDPALDPTILVAIVSGISAGLTALINGLLKILERKKTPAGKIIIEGRCGKLEVPAGTSPDEVALLVRQIKELDAERIKLG